MNWPVVLVGALVIAIGAAFIHKFPEAGEIGFGKGGVFARGGGVVLVLAGALFVLLGFGVGMSASHGPEITRPNDDVSRAEIQGPPKPSPPSAPPAVVEAPREGEAQPGQSFVQLASAPTEEEAGALARRQADEIVATVCVYASHGVFGTAVGPLPTRDAAAYLARLKTEDHPSVDHEALLRRGETYRRRGCFAPGQGTP